MVRERSKYQDEGNIVRMVEAWEKINADIAAEGESADMLTPRSLVNWAKNFCPLFVYLFFCNIEFVLTMLGLCCKMEVARTSGLQSSISY